MKYLFLYDGKVYAFDSFYDKKTIQGIYGYDLENDEEIVFLVDLINLKDLKK